MQLKTDILKEAVDIVSAVTSSDEPIDLEKSSDTPHPTNTPTNMLDILLNGIGGDKTTSDDQDNTATANILCENEMYQLLLGNDFKMKMQNIETKVYNCPLDWWKTSAHRFKNLERLAVKYLAISATSAPSECIWSRAARVLTAKRNRLSEEVSSAIMYCKKNRELLHKYYAEISKERMHPNNHHLIERHKALLPTLEHEKNAESNIDVGVDVEEV